MILVKHHVYEYAQRRQHCFTFSTIQFAEAILAQSVACFSDFNQMEKLRKYAAIGARL